MRPGVLQATERACSSELDQEVHDITEEVAKGWLAGPVPLEQLSETSSLSRRFGVEQRSSGVHKVRPIVNLSESFFNATASRTETIRPHGLDVVCAGIAIRLRTRDRFGLASVPKLKVVDLRKVYKQLGISVDALQDAFLCVPDPVSAKPSITSVVCCPSGLWLLGCALLFVHWTMFYEDFIVLVETSLTKHCDLMLGCCWSVLGWAVARDRETLLGLWGSKFASSLRVPSSSRTPQNVKPN